MKKYFSAFIVAIALVFAGQMAVALYATIDNVNKQLTILSTTSP